MTASRSAAVSARGVFAFGEHRATGAFRLAWGQAYDIGFAAGTWRAIRRDGPGTPITGTTPDELTRAIRADWARRSAG